MLLGTATVNLNAAGDTEITLTNPGAGNEHVVLTTPAMSIRWTTPANQPVFSGATATVYYHVATPNGAPCSETLAVIGEFVS